MSVNTISRIFRVELELDPDTNAMTKIYCHYYQYLPDPENPQKTIKDEQGNSIPFGGYKTVELDPSDKDTFPSLLFSQKEIGDAFVKALQELKSSS